MHTHLKLPMKALTLTITALFLSFMLSAQSPDWMWAKSLNGRNYKSASSVAVTNSGDILTVGQFRDTVDFNPDTAATYNLISTGQYDIYMCRYTANGDLVWAKSLEGPLVDYAGRITFLPTGNGSFYLTGQFESTIDLDPWPGVFTLSAVGGVDFFLAEYDSSGSLNWGISLGTGPNASPSAFDVEPSGNYIYLGGKFINSVDFDPGPGTTLLYASNDIH
jgi:hypothetical protein